LCALKSVPIGVSRGLGTIGAFGLIQNVSDVRSDGIETNRQYERNILVRPPDRKQTQNFDFASREVVRKRDTVIPRMQQDIDFDNQARHSKSARELLGLAQPLKARAALCVCLSHQESAVPE
jgi:hypothetical protein